MPRGDQRRGSVDTRCGKSWGPGWGEEEARLGNFWVLLAGRAKPHGGGGPTGWPVVAGPAPLAIPH